MEYSTPGQELGPSVAKAWIEGGEVKQLIAERQGVEGVFLIPKMNQAEVNATPFSELKDKQEDAPIVDALRLLEPRLSELILSIQGGKTLTKGNIGLQEYQPLFYMGEGINKLLTILLSIGSFPSGVVLIDETENGFLHSVLPDIWRVIIDTAQRLETQLFITTHSYQCMQAAHEESRKFDDPPCAFYRLGSDHEKLFAMPLSPETLDLVFESDLEIR